MLPLAVAVAAPARPPATHHARPPAAVDVPTRDGVALRTHVVLPSGDGPFPTVVTRTPYVMGPVLAQQCRTLARRGYACLWQATRGRLGSGGDWYPFVHEEADGQDLLAWVRAQPWSDGHTAWIGDSYLAATGWAVAVGDPDGLDTLIARVFAPSLYPAAFEDGLVRHELVTAWMTLMPDGRNRVLGVAHDYHAALAHRPRVSADVVASGHEVPFFRDWITAEEATDPRWTTGAAGRLAAAADDTHLPVLLVGGWSDPFLEAQLDAWARLPSKADSLLVVGPWAHLGQAPSALPLRGLRGPGSAGGRQPQMPRVLDWLDVHVRGASGAYPTAGAVTYVVGGDRWAFRPDWPPDTVETRWGAVAGAGRCDGTLVAGDAPSAPVTYTYDPDDPLPGRGGAGILAGAIPLFDGVRPGFVRGGVPCARRDDVLRYASAPLGAPLHLAGAVRVELEVSSDAPDTAFGFRLLARRPGGAEVVLREGFATLALRNGPPRTPYTPGDRVVVLPTAQPLEAELEPGTSLVLVVTSASFPTFEAHPNVAGTLAEAAGTRRATQTVHRATLVIPEVAAEVP